MGNKKLNLVVAAILALPTFALAGGIHIPKPNIPRPNIPSRPKFEANLRIELEIVRARVKNDRVELETHGKVRAELLGKSVEGGFTNTYVIDEEGEVRKQEVTVAGITCSNEAKVLLDEGIAMTRATCSGFGLSKSTPWVKKRL